MSINSPPKVDDDKHAGRNKRSMWWLFVSMLLVAVLIFLYHSNNLIKPRYNAVGIYHPPDYRPLPELGIKSAALIKPEGQSTAKTEKENTTPSPQVKPALAPAAALTSAVRLTPATVPKREEKPVQKGQANPTPAAVTPAKPQVKAGAQPAVVAVGGVIDAQVPVKAERKAAKPGLKGDDYTLLIGEFAGGRNMATLRAQLKKLGITTVQEKQIKRNDQMHRLFLASYDSYQAADTELQKLRQLASGVFIAIDKGKYAVYAGSYLHEKRAVAEQERLAGKNVKLSGQTALVTVSIKRVTAGSFSDSAAAHKEAARLQKQGVTARVVRNVFEDSP